MVIQILKKLNFLKCYKKTVGESMSSPVLSDSSPPYTEALESLSSERTRLGILIITRTFSKHE